jgi:DNA-binding NtrC family response regulator
MTPEPAKSLMIVDDERSYTGLLAQLLAENLDCPVVSFSQPRAALAAFAQLDVGLVITDYDMPDLNGFEFMAEVAKLNPHVPYILITGHPIEAVMDKLSGAVPPRAVLSKPFTWLKLGDEIIRHWPGRPLNFLRAK